MFPGSRDTRPPSSSRSVGETLFLWALWFVPSALRDRHRQDMIALFERHTSEAMRSGGRWAYARAVCRGLWDVSVHGALLRLRLRKPQSGGMRWSENRFVAVWEAIRWDARQVSRLALRQPGIALLLLTILGLGIGGSTTIFTVVDGVLLKPLPYPDANALVVVGRTREDPAKPGWTAYPEVVEWREQLASVEGLAAVRPSTVVVHTENGTERIWAAGVSRGFLATLGIQPESGRGFSDEDHQPGASPGVLISRSLRERLALSAADGGGTITLGAGGSSGIPVVGVLPSDFTPPIALLPPGVELWYPIPEGSTEDMSFTDFNVRVLGRLSRGGNLAGTQVEVRRLAAAMDVTHPEINAGRATPMGIGAETLHDLTVGDAQASLLLLLGASGVLLLTTCLTVAGVLVARSSERVRELGIRMAIGAGRGSIVRMLVGESVLIGALGGLLGLGVAHAGLVLVGGLVPDSIPRMHEVGIDGRALLFAVACSLTSGLAFGLLPALLGARTNVVDALGAGFTGTGSRLWSFFRSGLVVLETAGACVLLVGASALVSAYGALAGVDPGFELDNLHETVLQLSSTQLEGRSAADVLRSVLTRIGASPDVEAAAASVDPPMGGNVWGAEVSTRRMAPGEQVVVSGHMVTPGYFSTMGMPVRQGREFRWSDDDGSAPVVVVTADFARRLWPDGDALGQQLRASPDADAPWLEVVGVVGEVREAGLDADPAQAIYVPYAQRTGSKWLAAIIRSPLSPGEVGRLVRDALTEQAPGVPFEGTRAVRARLRSMLTNEMLRMTVVGLFAVLALLLASGALYAAVRHLVGTRTHEMGVRLALGARPEQVWSQVMWDGIKLSALGAALGLGIMFVLAKTAASFLAGFSRGDPVPFVASVALTLVTAALASYTPARRAARIKPTRAFRSM